MTRVRCCVLLLALLGLGCKSSTESGREAALREKELALAKRELQARESELQQLRLQDSIAAEKGPSLSEMYSRVKDAVWVVYADYEDGGKQGSAFTIDPRGVLVSNHHVFADAYGEIHPEYIRAINASGEEYRVSRIMAFSADDDYVVALLAGAPEAGLPTVSLAAVEPEIGEECFAVGNPKGLTHTLSKGIISGYRDGRKHVQTTAEIAPGSSGGPLFNSTGAVVGITTSTYGVADLNLALNIRRVPISASIPRAGSERGGGTRPPVKADGADPVPAERVRSVVDGFFAANQRGDYAGMATFLAPVLNRYFYKEHITRDDALASSREYDAKNNASIRSVDIHWPSAEIRTLPDGYITKFTMDYSINFRGAVKNYHIAMTVGLAPNFQINYLAEKILSRS